MGVLRPSYCFMQCTIRVCAFLALGVSVAFCAYASPRSSAGAAGLRKATVAASPSVLAPGTDVGMWVWHREEVMDPAAREELVSFCVKYGITRIFVQVRFEEDGGSVHLAAPESWHALLRSAARAHIAVEALDGRNDMGFAENRSETLARLAAVLDFQRRQPANALFSGLHYDIEPYTSARWKRGDEQAVMREFLETAVAIRDAARAVDPKLAICHDIPAFYDGQEKHMVEFGGVRKNFHEHIQDLADYTGIMSYRTRATGTNSVASISAAELAYAAKTGKRVYLSLETVPLKDTPQITFHGRPPAEYRAAITELSEHLKDNPAFGGIMLHQYRTIKALLEGPAPVSAKP